MIRVATSLRRLAAADALASGDDLLRSDYVGGVVWEREFHRFSASHDQWEIAFTRALEKTTPDGAWCNTSIVIRCVFGSPDRTIFIRALDRSKACRCIGAYKVHLSVVAYVRDGEFFDDPDPLLLELGGLGMSRDHRSRPISETERRLVFDAMAEAFEVSLPDWAFVHAGDGRRWLADATSLVPERALTRYDEILHRGVLPEVGDRVVYRRGVLDVGRAFEVVDGFEFATRRAPRSP